ncbi:MAG: BglG family transcription antiterminator, partial [Coprococcus sp.]
MDMTPRMKQIFRVLLRENGPISVKELAARISVSKRTVQREMEYINSSLRGYDIHFVSKTGVGIWLEGSQEEKNRLLEDISGGDNYDVSNREERRKRLILEILKEKGLKKLFYYSVSAGVSEATVSTDLEAVEKWLNRYGLQVVRKPGSGVLVDGTEENYRRAIRAFINENIDTKVIREAYEGEISGENGRFDMLKKSNIGQILNDDIMRRVMDCIVGMDDARVLTLTENSYVGLVIHISIAINRILKNEVIEDDGRWSSNGKKDEDYQLAQSIVRELEEEFEIEIPDVEVAYICLHIKGAKHEKIQWGGKNSASLENRELQQLVNAMIDAYDSEKAYLLKQDDEFIQGLLAHLQPTLIRLMHGMQIENPVLMEIQRDYPDMYDRCIHVAGVIEASIGKPVPPEEIGFLTVHFGAAMVRLQGRSEQVRRVHAGVICSSGIGVSRLMTSKLERVFRDRMDLTTFGKNDITPYVIGKMDFFISSIPMEQLEVPVIFVNPLLGDDDMEHIRNMIYQYARTPEKHKAADTFSMQLEEINLMAAQINMVIKYMDFFKVDNRISFDELLIAVSEKLSPYSDRREMIREDIRRREQIASQIFAEFGFALLHTRTKGVIRPVFNVCMTKDLGPFEDPYFKGISMVFVMLVPMDDHVQVNNDILGYISSVLIEEYEFLDIVSRGQKEEIRSALSGYLKKYFNKYLAGLH